MSLKRIIPLTHEEWIIKRKNGLGGSDASVIMGVNPWKTEMQLWKEKTGVAEPDDISMQPQIVFGKEAESHIRALFALEHPEYKVDYHEYDMLTNEKLDFCFATLDGELTESSGRKGILEIKTTEILNSSQWKHWDEQIPDYYYCQILHQFLATGYEFAILKARIRYTDKHGNKNVSIRHYHIERAECETDIKVLADKEQKFWKCVKTNKAPNFVTLPQI